MRLPNFDSRVLLILTLLLYALLGDVSTGYAQNAGTVTLPKCDPEIDRRGLDIRAEKGMPEEIQFYEQLLKTCQPDSELTALFALRFLEYSRWPGHHGRASYWRERGDELSRRALHMNPNSSYAHEIRATYFGILIENSPVWRLGSLSDSVYVYAHKSVALNPENHVALSILGRWYFEASGLPWFVDSFRRTIYANIVASYEKALSYYERAYRMYPQVDYLFWQGLALHKLGNYEESQRIFRELADKSPEDFWDSSIPDHIARYVR